MTKMQQTQPTNKKGKNQRCSNSPKRPFFRMNKAQGYFGAKAGDATPNADVSPLQPGNTEALLKCDIWIGPQTRITALGKWGLTNTLQN